MTTVIEDRDFIQSVISSTLLEESIEWIKANLEPGEVFEKSELIDWAEAQGYTIVEEE